MKLSSGMLLYRMPRARVEVLLVHMGGPFWARKDEHAWSIPKGEYAEGEDPRAVAAREFAEELGASHPDGPTFELGSARAERQDRHGVRPGGRFRRDHGGAATPSAWSGRRGPAGSRTFPRSTARSGSNMPTAATKLVKGQVVFLTRLMPG